MTKLVGARMHPHERDALAVAAAREHRTVSGLMRAKLLEWMHREGWMHESRPTSGGAPPPGDDLPRGAANVSPRAVMVGARLHPHEHDALTRAADHHGRTRSGLLRATVLEWLDECRAMTTGEGEGEGAAC